MREDIIQEALKSRFVWQPVPGGGHSFQTVYMGFILCIRADSVRIVGTSRNITYKGYIDAKLTIEDEDSFAHIEHHLVTSVDRENTGSDLPEENKEGTEDLPVKRNLKELLHAIVEGVAMYDHNTGFGILVHYLEKEDEARLHRVAKEDSATIKQGKFPRTGRVVQLARGERKKIIVSFNTYTDVKEGETYQNSCMDYDIREFSKIHLHIWEWLANRMIPEADGEFK
jgi:hypothetical protein